MTTKNAFSIHCKYWSSGTISSCNEDLLVTASELRKIGYNNTSGTGLKNASDGTVTIGHPWNVLLEHNNNRYSLGETFD